MVSFDEDNADLFKILEIVDKHLDRMEARKNTTYQFPGELEFLRKYDKVSLFEKTTQLDSDINTPDLLSLNLNLTGIEDDFDNEIFLSTEFQYIFASTLKDELYDAEFSKDTHLILIYELLRRGLYHAKHQDDIYEKLLPFIRDPKDVVSKFKKSLYKMKKKKSKEEDY